MTHIERYIDYIRNIRRFSPRTVKIYSDVLDSYVHHALKEGETSDQVLIESLNLSELRAYQMELLDARKMSPRTVCQHMSALSGFCRYLIKDGVINSNPVALIPKPKTEKRLPHYYRKDAMEDYFKETEIYTSRERLDCFALSPESKEGKKSYQERLARMIISLLHGLGIRRSELISLNVGSIDFGRKVAKVHGKGDKMREIPLFEALIQEISLYLESVEVMTGGKRSLTEPLLVTYTGNRLYPAYVDRTVKSELGSRKGISGRRSPHVLRHTLATELMNEGAGLQTIKEMLGHSSLAATQVYTHNSIARLKDIYKRSHPRAKNGGKHGD